MIAAEFESEAALLSAVHGLRERGLEVADAFTPFPVEALDEALGLRASPVNVIALGAGVLGAAVGYAVQWYCNAVSWPIDVGARPPHSPLAFVPISFETFALITCTSVFIALMVLFGFPHVTHPVLNVEAFRSASIDGFWLSLDEGATRDEVVAAFRALGARRVVDLGAKS